jgi:hypothetical protein
LGFASTFYNYSSENIYVLAENGTSYVMIPPNYYYPSDNHDGFISESMFNTSNPNWFKTPNWWPGSSQAYDATYYGTHTTMVNGGFVSGGGYKDMVGGSFHAGAAHAGHELWGMPEDWASYQSSSG